MVRENLAGTRRGRADNCRARGARIGFPATRSTRTLGTVTKLLLLVFSLMTSGVVLAQSAADERWAAYKAKMDRLNNIEKRAYRVLPKRRETPVREENIRDREVEEIQLATANVMPGAIVNIGTVVTGCPCEDGSSCTDQVWIVAYRPEKSTGFLLSKIRGHWTIGPVQRWWWDYQDYFARRDWKSRNWEKLMERFPVCTEDAVVPETSGNVPRP